MSIKSQCVQTYLHTIKCYIFIACDFFFYNIGLIILLNEKNKSLSDQYPLSEHVLRLCDNHYFSILS